MNQGKLEVVKQDMARVNFDILVISELKRTVMCEFNLNDHYIYYHGQESLRINGEKRGPGNRGPTECGTTHEATSGMSS